MSVVPDTSQPIAPSKQGRFAINLFANVGYLALTMFIGVWYVPFLVRHLGPAVYGLLPLATTLTSYMSLVTLGLNSAVGRSMTIAFEQGDTQEANHLFNTSIWSTLALSVVLLVPAALGVIYINWLIRVPAGYEVEVRWLFAGTIAAFLLNEMKSPFEVSSFCCNRFDLRNLVAAAETLARVGMVIALFLFLAPRPKYLGIAIFCGTVVSALGSIWLWRRLTPQLHIRPGLFDWRALRSLTRTGSWVVVNQVGVLLYLSIELVLANRLFGAEAGGRYAAVLQLPLFIRSLAVAIGTVFMPTTLYLYARKDIEGLVIYLRHAIKFVGLALALPIGLTCGFSEPLLRLWLGPSFSTFAPLLFLMVVHLCINLSMHPLYALPLAVDRVKLPGIVMLGVGAGNLILALFLARTLGWGLYGLAAAGAIMLTARHLLFTPLYGAHILGRSRGTFFRGLVPNVAITIVTIGLCRLVLLRWEISNWLNLAGAGLGISLLYVAIVYCFLLTPEERKELWRFIPSREKNSAPDHVAL